MKSLTRFIQEKLIIKKNKYKYFPQTKEELQDLILQRIKDEGNEVDLNGIDVSKITDMEGLFWKTNFNGNISNWDVSNVKIMRNMFAYCKSFNKDISAWDVSNVTDMRYMFYECTSFNQNISNWDVSNVTDMFFMFAGCKRFNSDISNWNVSNVNNIGKIFDMCPIKEKYKPKFV